MVHVAKSQLGKLDPSQLTGNTISIDPGSSFTDLPVSFQVITHDSFEALDAAVPDDTSRYHDGLNVIFHPVYHFNIGHALWDGFYPVFVSMLQLGLHNERYRTWLMAKRDQSVLRRVKNSYDNTETALSLIGGRGILSVDHMMNDTESFNAVHRLQEAVLGVGTNAQKMDINANYSIGACRALDACRQWRERIFSGMGIPKAEPARRTPPFRAIFVENKRYGGNTEMEAMIKQLNSHPDLKAEFDIKFVAWTPVSKESTDSPMQSGNFTRHMEIIRNTDIHISGPGTGQMYQAWLPDGAIHINLGDTKVDQGFMEEYVAEGCPHLKTLYYTRRKKDGPGLLLSIMQPLLLKAGELLKQGYTGPAPINHNLSPVGQVWKAYTWLVNREDRKEELEEGLAPIRCLDPKGEMWMGNRFPEEFVYVGLPGFGPTANPDYCVLGVLQASFDTAHPESGYLAQKGWFGTAGALPWTLPYYKRKFD
mmetsp:Transcript_52942/g.115805  ORF Transcript_52942/g.115805 Transcript_52942/m.115805 type:complete len:479 (+) Transcript_52942:718-2154(+)